MHRFETNKGSPQAMAKRLHLDDLAGNCSIAGHRNRVHVVSAKDNPAQFLVLHVYM
jgi:hypothetical protein